MKFFLAIALLVVAASAASIKPNGLIEEVHQIQEIMAAINSPSTDPATAQLLLNQLEQMLGMGPEPVHVVEEVAVPPAPVVFPTDPAAVILPMPVPTIPEIIGAIIGGIRPPTPVVNPTPVIVQPTPLPTPIVDPTPVIVQPTPVVEPTPVVAPTPQASPLVQIIVNVQGQNVGANPVSVGPAVVPVTPIVEEEHYEVVRPTPVHVIDEDFPEILPIMPVHPGVVQPPMPVIIDPMPVHPGIVGPIDPMPVHPGIVEPPMPVIINPVLPEPVVLPPAPVIVAPVEPISVGEPVLPIPVGPVILPDTLN